MFLLCVVPRGLPKIPEKASALLVLNVFPQKQTKKKTVTATSTQLLWSSWFHLYNNSKGEG